MQSFIERFYDDVDTNLDDPRSSKRTTKQKKLALLHTVDRQIWEKILMLTGQESMAGYAEVDITLSDGQAFYLLPGNFRQFVRLERRTDGNRNSVEAQLNSIPFYSTESGVVILTEQRGILVKPTPVLTSVQTWTLCYLAGPISLHYATAGAVNETTVTAGSPGADAGDLVLSDGYYDNSMLRIYDAETGALQVREISKWNRKAKVFTLRHAWTTLPTGAVKYEIRPSVPPAYDDLYAMDVAIRILGQRRRGRSGLKADRNELWNACTGYFLSNTMDRAPERTLPIRHDEVDPYFGT